MVVCICNAIREKDLRDAAKKGASTPYYAYTQMGCKRAADMRIIARKSSAQNLRLLA